jgi:hypothetical protein
MHTHMYILKPYIYIYIYIYTEATKISGEAPSVKAHEEAFVPWANAQELLKEIKKAMAPSKVKPSMLKSMHEMIIKLALI